MKRTTVLHNIWQLREGRSFHLNSVAINCESLEKLISVLGKSTDRKGGERKISPQSNLDLGSVLTQSLSHRQLSRSTAKSDCLLQPFVEPLPCIPLCYVPMFPWKFWRAPLCFWKNRKFAVADTSSASLLSSCQPWWLQKSPSHSSPFLPFEALIRKVDLGP